MKSFAPAALFCIASAGIMFAQSTSQPVQIKPSQATSASPIPGKIEAYLRNLNAWGPSFKVTVGPLKDSPVPDLYSVTVGVSQEDQTDSANFYVSKDGKFLIGEMQDIDSDPFAATRKQIDLTGAPSKGPKDAKVVIVEYADFECPSCRQMETILRANLPNFPQVRFVFKDFPLTQVHPWAMTAAEAGRCAFQQSEAGFWRFHDLIFDRQDLVSPENAYQKMQDYAAEAGLDPKALATCVADPSTQAEVNKSIAEGLALRIGNTPTTFVNGRRIIGPDPATLDQFIRYELLPRQ
jgi:protein-disulfide isomerase